MSTYLQLCADLASQIGYSSPASVVSQSGESLRIVNRIAQADLEIQNKYHDWRFLSSESNTPYSQALTIGQATKYTKPTDHGVWDMETFILDFALDDYQRLMPLDFDDFWVNYRPGTQTNDTPTRVILDANDDIIVWPPASSTRTMTARYSILPVVMAENTDVSPIPVQFHRMIVLKAKIFYGADDDAPEVYADANYEYAMMMSQLEAFSLPDQGNRGKARGSIMAVRAE